MIDRIISEDSWEHKVRQWALKRRNSNSDLVENIVQFFVQAFENTSRSEQAWFGVHSSSISLVVGGIYLASVNSAGAWLLIDKYFQGYKGLDCRIVRSTKKSKEPLVWLHAQKLIDIKKIVEEDQFWQSYMQASEKIFNSPISVSRNEDWQRKRKKIKLCDFWNKNKKEEIIFPEEVSSIQTYYEGSVRQVTVNAYERDKNARKKCIEIYGNKCIICSFDFGLTYGEHLKNYIHVHHLRPLAEIRSEYKVNPLTDLCPVCPNCHAVIHKRNPPFSIEEVKAMISDKVNS